MTPSRKFNLFLGSFWQICIKLPTNDLAFWGTLLATVWWILWIERNKRVFQRTDNCSAQSIYYVIYNLYTYWVEVPTNVAHLFSRIVIQMDRSLISNTGGSGTADAQVVQVTEDEDLPDG